MRYDKAFRDSGYLSTLLTSFEFDPIVFENVVLAGLTAGGARDITVVADTERVNAQFAEYGPPRQAGRYYHFAKRKVAGRFHPKIVLQAGEKKARLMVGSANLTGSGIMGNLEAIATLDASNSEPWAAPILRAARAYLGQHISQSDRAGRAALTRFDMRAPWLTDVAPHRSVEDPEGNRHGLLHEDTDSSIADQLAAFIDEDPIHRLILVSPFWNSDLQAVNDLSESLGGPETNLVLNPGDHPIDPESLESTAFTIHDAADLLGGQARRLHAKMLIACGARADYTMTGSANMTREALFARAGGPGNAEVCLVRTEGPGTAIQRLGLSDCLGRPLAIADHPPSPRESGTGTDTFAARDGGGLYMQLGFLTWTPPWGQSSQGCQIMLHGRGDEPIATVTPESKDGRLVTEIEHLDPTPCRGRVVFADGVVSAPVPIADLDRLARLGHDRLPAAQAKLLAELGDMRSFDGQALDLATRIRAMVDAEQNQRAGNRSRDTQRTRSGTDEEDTTPMTREEFLGSDAEADIERAEAAWRQSAMGEVRRQITAALGLGLETIEEDFEEEVSS